MITSGHRHGGQASRTIKGEATFFNVFAPVALAAIGKPPNPLPLPIAHRCVTIQMERAPANEPLIRFDPKTKPRQRTDLETVYGQVFAWAQACQTIELDPPMPAELRNRLADNWRSLIAIADTAGPEWGKAARAAAVELSAGQDEVVGVRLLEDIKDVFDDGAIDRITSTALVEALVELPDSPWSEWRGPQDNQQPRKLTPASLAMALASFGIRPRSIWSPGKRVAGVSSRKGYLRSEFEAAWASYCGAGTPAHHSNIKHLRGV